MLVGVDAPLTCMKVHPLVQQTLSLFTGKEPLYFLLFHSPSTVQSESSTCYVHKNVEHFCNTPVLPAVTFLCLTTFLQPPYLNQLLSTTFGKGSGFWRMLRAKTNCRKSEQIREERWPHFVCQGRERQQHCEIKTLLNASRSMLQIDGNQAAFILLQVEPLV